MDLLHGFQGNLKEKSRILMDGFFQTMLLQMKYLIQVILNILIINPCIIEK